MKPRYHILRNSIIHFNFVLVWIELTLKISDYWVQNDGCDYLPHPWVFYSQKIEKGYENWIILLGITCSTLIGCQSLSKRVPYFWELFLASLWIVLNLVTAPYLKMLTVATLSLAVMCQIISSTFKKHQLIQTNEHVNSKVCMSKSESSPVINPPCELDLSKLDLGTRSHRSTLSKRSISSERSSFIKSRPLISPSRFSPSSIGSSPSNLTKASWVAGGYWQRNNWPASNFTSSSPTITPLTRSSSQSSGFGSVKSAFPSRSPPESRPESVVEEIDRLSVFSDDLEARSVKSNFRYADNSPLNYSYAHELTRKSLLSTVPSVSGSAHPLSPIPPANHWSCQSLLLGFFLGFSVAINLCFLAYYYVAHNSMNVGG